MNFYIIGSLRNPEVPRVAAALRAEGHDAYDDWYSPGPEADDHWQAYEAQRGRSYIEALNGWHAKHVFEDDKKHIDAADAGVLVLPAGRSAHLEAGYLVGRGRPVYILLPAEPDRYDIMYRFATAVLTDKEALIEHLTTSQ